MLNCCMFSMEITQSVRHEGEFTICESRRINSTCFATVKLLRYSHQAKIFKIKTEICDFRYWF